MYTSLFVFNLYERKEPFSFYQVVDFENFEQVCTCLRPDDTIICKWNVKPKTNANA